MRSGVEDTPTSLIPFEALADMLAIAAETPPGDFVELGVYKGGSALHLYALAQEQGRTLHLFDTFAGHTIVDLVRDNAIEHYLGRFADNANWLRRLRNAMPHARFYVGTFPDSLPSDLANIAFVHSDVDLYWPTKAVCELLPPRMVTGGRILFDDYSFPECPGVQAAVDAAFGPATPETMRATGRRCVRIGNHRVLGSKT